VSDAAFERVADVLLAPLAEAPLVVALAGSGSARLEPVERGLMAAAIRARVPLGVVSDTPSMDCPPAPPPGPQGAARILLVADGLIDEARIAHLPGCAAQGPDLLIWVFADQAPPSLRSLYLMGMWTWARGPTRLRCLLPGGRAQRVEAIERVGQAMTAAEVPLRAEVLTIREDDLHRGPGLLDQLLQSALAAARRSASRPAQPWASRG
jgi:hypothetical protein